MIKILYVNGFSINEKNGTANTLHNIYDDIVIQKELCINYYVKEKKEFTIGFWFSPLTYLLYLCRRKHKKNEYRKNASGANQTKGFVDKIKMLLRAIADNFPVHITKKTRQELSKYSPDYIYTLGASIKSLKTAYRVGKLLNKPIILHMMDNWDDTLYVNSVFVRPYNKIIKKYLKKINHYSKINFAISQPLCEKMHNNYGGTYFVLGNPCIIKKNIVNITSKDNDFKFLYAGTLTINRKESLVHMLEMIHTYAKSNALNYFFDIYVPSDEINNNIIESFSRFNCAVYQYVPYEEILQQYALHSALFLVESFDSDYIEFTKYSISTKTHEYMAAGRLVFALIPDSIYLNNYLRSTKAAIVCNSDKELKEKIPLLFDVNYCSEMGAKGYLFVKNNLRKEVIQRKVVELLNENLSK